MTMKTGFVGPSNEGNCGVSSVATVLGIPFNAVKGYIKHRWNLRENWKGSTVLMQRTDALDHFGASFRVVKYAKYERPLVWEFALKIAKPGVTYLIDIAGHTFVLKDCMVVDQKYPTPTHFAWTRAGKSNYGNWSIDCVVEITHVPDAWEMEKKEKSSLEGLKDAF